MCYMSTQNTIGVIDLFCGIGGLSHGMECSKKVLILLLGLT